MAAEPISPLILTIIYWLHMVATVVWIGGLAALGVFVLPAAQKTLDHIAYSALLLNLQRRLQNIGWFSLAVLGLTGMFQMSANSSYTGFLEIGSTWAAAIFVKHLVIGLMVVVSIAMTWGVLPALQRSALMRSTGRVVVEAEERRLKRREAWLLNANLVLSLVVLLLTAWARSAN